MFTIASIFSLFFTDFSDDERKNYISLRKQAEKQKSSQPPDDSGGRLLII